MSTKSPLDGMLARRQISPVQYAAARAWLTADDETRDRCRAAVGSVGMELLELVLGLRMTLTEIATARGDCSNKEMIYLGRRLRECLDMLAEVFARPTLRQRGLRFRNSPVVSNSDAAPFCASPVLRSETARAARDKNGRAQC